MRFWIIIVTFLSTFTSTSSRCHNIVGFYNLDSNGETWNSALEGITTDASNSTCELELQVFSTQEDMVQAVIREDIDFILTTPSLMICLVTQYNVSMIAGFLNRISGVVTENIGGNIYVRKRDMLRIPDDLVGKNIIANPPYNMGGFQIQADRLKESGVDVFKDSKILAFENNRTLMIDSLLSNTFDIAFIRSDDDDDAIDDSLELFQAQKRPEYPLPISSRLFPEWNIASIGSTPHDVNRNIAQQLLDMNETTISPPGPFWTIPHNFNRVLNLEKSLGVMNDENICDIPATNDFLSYIRCPDGTSKLSNNDIARNCKPYTVECAGRTCSCSPCFVILDTEFFSMTPALFWMVLVGFSVTVIGTGWLLQNIFRSHLIVEMPIQHLDFPSTREVLARSKYGDIVKARLTTPGIGRGKPVAVHRILPATNNDGLNEIFGEPPDHQEKKARDRVLSRTSDICRIRHPHFLRAFGVVTFKKELLIVLEYPEIGTLFDLLHNETIKLDMAAALRILKEIGLALQCIHSEKPPMTHKVTLYNTWLDANRSVMIMLSDNFNAPTKSTSADIYHFGTVMMQVLQTVLPPQIVEPHNLQTRLKDPILLIRDCRDERGQRRPDITSVIKRLTRCQYAWQVQLEKEALKKDTTAEQNKTILHSMLPKAVAEALRAGKTIKPQNHDLVSILFTDIVGFTSIADKLPPRKIMDLLDRLFVQFDQLAEVYGVFKIDTAGDNWLGTTNLMSQAPDHTSKLALFALEIVKIAETTLIDTDTLESPSRTLNIRVGIHAGPVVTSVVGSLERNPKFCMFGSSVNLASRMESTSLPGRIQLSEVAAELVQEQNVELAKRQICPRPDKPDVKGKGIMQTYWLVADNDYESTESNSSKVI